MIEQIKFDIDSVLEFGNTVDEIVLSHVDYREAFGELGEGQTLQTILGYPATVTPNRISYIIFTDQDGERRHKNIGSSSPSHISCE